MIDQTSSTTSRRGFGLRAAAVHTVSVQTIAAAGLNSGSRSREIEHGHGRFVREQVVAFV